MSNTPDLPPLPEPDLFKGLRLVPFEYRYFQTPGMAEAMKYDVEAEYFSAETTIAYAQAYAAPIMAQLEAARAALLLICKNAPTEEPDPYDGDNHGDTAWAASQMEHFTLAQIARAALTQPEQPKDTK